DKQSRLGQSQAGTLIQRVSPPVALMVAAIAFAQWRTAVSGGSPGRRGGAPTASLASRRRNYGRTPPKSLGLAFSRLLRERFFPAYAVRRRASRERCAHRSTGGWCLHAGPAAHYQTTLKCCSALPWSPQRRRILSARRVAPRYGQSTRQQQELHRIS